MKAVRMEIYDDTAELLMCDATTSGGALTKVTKIMLL
jgi:hypothetical protein